MATEDVKAEAVSVTNGQETNTVISPVAQTTTVGKAATAGATADVKTTEEVADTKEETATADETTSVLSLDLSDYTEEKLTAMDEKGRAEAKAALETILKVDIPNAVLQVKEALKVVAALEEVKVKTELEKLEPYARWGAIVILFGLVIKLLLR